MTPAVSDWVEHSCLKCVCLLDAGKVRFVHFVHFPTVVSLPLSFRAAQTAKNLTNVRLPVTFSAVLAFARDDGSKAIRFLAVSETSRESDSHLFPQSPHLQSAHRQFLDNTNPARRRDNVPLSRSPFASADIHEFRARGRG